MKVGIPKEIAEGERRVALVPETVKRLAGKDIEVAVEAGAGEGAFIPDSEYEAAGATIVAEPSELFGGVDVVVKVNAPTLDGSAGLCEIDLLKKDGALVALLYPRTNADVVRRLAEAGVTSFSLDLMPRITRAQSMDVLSSHEHRRRLQGRADGRRRAAGDDADDDDGGGHHPAGQRADHRRRRRGPAGHRHARRLGAVVKAVDVRPAVQEQIESLGAQVRLDGGRGGRDAETAGGYAEDLGEEFYRKQQEILAPHVEESDLVITTAPRAGPRGAAS